MPVASRDSAGAPCTASNTAPNPVTNVEFTRALGGALHRPTVLPTPLFPLKLRYGGELVVETMVRVVLPTVRSAVLAECKLDYVAAARLRDERALHARAADDYLLLLEHPHVFTLGTGADPGAAPPSSGW